MAAFTLLENRVDQHTQILQSLHTVSDDHADQLDDHTDQLDDHEYRITDVEIVVADLQKLKQAPFP